ACFDQRKVTRRRVQFGNEQPAAGSASALFTRAGEFAKSSGWLFGRTRFPKSDRRGVEVGGSKNLHRRHCESHDSGIASKSAPTQSAAGCPADHHRLFAAAKIDIAPGAGQSTARNLRNFRGTERVGQGVENSGHRGRAIESSTGTTHWRQAAFERSARV